MVDNSNWFVLVTDDGDDLRTQIENFVYSNLSRLSTYLALAEILWICDKLDVYVVVDALKRTYRRKIVTSRYIWTIDLGRQVPKRSFQDQQHIWVRIAEVSLSVALWNTKSSNGQNFIGTDKQTDRNLPVLQEDRYKTRTGSEY